MTVRKVDVSARTAPAVFAAAFLDSPDWRDAKQYPARATAREWAWEFLRRNPAYRLAWAEFAALAGAQRTQYGERWGLRAIADPRFARARAVFLKPTPAKVLMRLVSATEDAESRAAASSRARDGYLQLISGEPHEAIVVFDLRYPIAPQLKNLEARLEAERELQRGGEAPAGVVRPHRMQHDAWRKYLRALDASDDRAQLVEIETVLRITSPVPGKAASQLLQQARAVRDRDWLRLAHSKDGESVS